MESQTHQEKVISQFTQQALPFANNEAHSLDQSFAVFCELGDFSGRERILDAGCGPGLVSCFLAPHVAEIVGIDLTPAMTGLARQRAQEAGRQNTSFVEADMTHLPFPDGDFDAAVTRYAFHHLENPTAAFAELVRVTRPGGRIIVVDATPESAKRSAYDTFERLRDPSHTSALTREELVGLGRSHRLSQPRVVEFGVPMDVAALIDSSFPTKTTHQQLTDLLAADLERDALSFKIRREAGSLCLTFPITAAGWQL